MSEINEVEHIKEGSSADDTDDSNGYVHVGPTDGAAADEASVFVESANDSSNREEHIEQSDRASVSAADSVQSAPNDIRVTEDVGKEDMFVDCPDEIETSETQVSLEENDDEQEIQSREFNDGTKVHDPMTEMENLHYMLKKTAAERDSFAQKYEEERATTMNHLTQLHYHLETLNEQPTLFSNSEGERVNHPYKLDTGDEDHDVLNKCYKYLETFSNERYQTQGTINELYSYLSSKDQEIESLRAKVNELSMSNESSGVQLEKYQHVEDIANRMLNFLASAGYQEEMLDESLIGKISHVEKAVNLIITEKSNIISEFTRKVTDLDRELSEARHENQQLLEQLDNHKALVENANAEIQKLNAELEREKAKLGNTKEKLSMAVTKGKALVQQRDSLKQLLAEKTSELERCLIELQEKSNALDSLKESVAEKTSELERCHIELQEKSNALDSLKESVAEKTSELERCQIELQEKSNALDSLKESATEKTSELERCQIELQENSNALDSLKESVTEKTSELERCLFELQEKSNALEAAEQSKDSLIQTETLAASLQDTLTQKDSILQKCEEILLEAAATEEPQSVDIIDKVRQLRDERNAMKSISLEFHRLTDTLSSFDFPETVKSNGFDTQISWLLESFTVAKEEAAKWQDDIFRTREAANNDIDRLTTSLLAESQEKDYLQAELDDLKSMYKAIVEKEYQASMEKDRIVNELLEASGMTTADQEKDYDISTIINNCVAKMKEDTSSSFDLSHIEVENSEKFQILLYTRDLELTLRDHIYEEEMLDKAEVTSLSNELVVLRNELSVLKDEKDSLQKDLERSEEKVATVREKLTMAVKKGKGLFQERENLKKSLNEKNTETENLKSELQQQVSVCNDLNDQISKLSADLERIPKLEADLVVIGEQKNQVEKFLEQSNSMLQRVFESIDGIILPADSVSEEPVEKVKWLVGYVSQCRSEKIQMEEELAKAKDEVDVLAGKLKEVQQTTKLSQDALSIAETKFSELLEEKKDLEISKTRIEEELQKAIEEVSSQKNSFAQVCASQKSLQDALQMAENNISMLISEKEEALASRAAAEMEIQKVKDQNSIHTTKLSEADEIIQSLEEALSEAQTNVSLFAEDNKKAIYEKSNLEKEMKKLKEEVDSNVVRFNDANLNIKSLEDALQNGESKISNLLNEKHNAEKEISELNIKLNACMQELAGTHGSLENRSMELSDQLNSLRRLMKDGSLASSLRQSFEKKIGSLKSMNLLLTEITDYVLETDSETLQNDPALEDDPSMPTLLSAGLDNFLPNVEMANGEEIATDGESIVVLIGKTVEGLHLRDKVLADKVEGFSSFMDNLIASLLTKLQATKGRFITMQEHINSLKQKVNDMEMEREAREKTLTMLESDIKSLLPACTDATKELESTVQNSLSVLRSNSELGEVIESVSMELETVDQDNSEFVKAAEGLLYAARRSQNLSIHFQNVVNKMIGTIEYLQNELKETKSTSEKYLEERDLFQNKISDLESDLEASERLAKEMRLRLEDYQEKEKKLNEKEAELSLLRASSLQKIQEAEDPLLSAAEMKSLFDKITGIEVPLPQFGDSQAHYSADVSKLFYIVDNYNSLKQQISLLSHDKEKLQSILEEQFHEIEQMKQEAEEHNMDMNNSKKMNKEILDLAIGLENIIQKLGGDELIEHQSTASVTGLLHVLDKLVVAKKRESESFKSKAEELDEKLIGTQKVLEQQVLEIEQMKEAAKEQDKDKNYSKKTNKELLELTLGLENIIQKHGGDEFIEHQNMASVTELLEVLNKLLVATKMETENFKSKAEEIGVKLFGTQKVVDDLSNKVRLLEGSSQLRVASPETIQEKGVFESSSSPSQTEISEIQDMGPISKNKAISSVASAAHPRTLRKGSSDHLAITIDSDSERLINKETNEEKGHVFKSLNSSRLIPIQAKMVADRIDGMWVSGSRALMNHPRARLGVIGYWLFVHLWLLAAIL